MRRVYINKASIGCLDLTPEHGITSFQVYKGELYLVIETPSLPYLPVVGTDVALSSAEGNWHHYSVKLSLYDDTMSHAFLQLKKESALWTEEQNAEFCRVGKLIMEKWRAE